MAMMLTSRELLRPWVLGTLAGLAADDEHHARLRETLLVFLQTRGSYKTTAQRLMLHKNTVQYRVRKAEESLVGPWAKIAGRRARAACKPLARLGRAGAGALASDAR